MIASVLAGADLALARQRETRGLETALHALAARDFTRADAILGECLKRGWRDERGLEARVLAARASLGLGDAARARDLLFGLELELPEIADVILQQRAHAHARLAEWREAYDAAAALVAQHTASPLRKEARYMMAEALFELGRLTEARAAYEAALKDAPRSLHEPRARLNLARIAERQKQWVIAGAAYRYLAELRPEGQVSAEAARRLFALEQKGLVRRVAAPQLLVQVDVLLRARSLDEAEKLLRAIRPDGRAVTRGDLQARAAELAYRREDYDRAATLFAALSQVASARERSRFEQLLARTYSSAKRYDDAIAVYLRLAERDRRGHEGREALFRAGWLASYAGDTVRAHALFDRYLERYPRDKMASEVVWYQAFGAYRRGDFELAKQTFVALRQRFPGTTLAQQSWYWQARSSEHQGDMEGRRLALREAVAISRHGYYGILAAQALNRPGSGRVIGAECLVREAGVAPMAELPPLGLETLLWQSPEGERTRRFLRLGLFELAADTAVTIPAAPAAEPVDVAYERARLLYELEDFGAAYRLSRRLLGGELMRAPRRYLHLAYPQAYSSEVGQAAREFGVSPWLILAMMRQESNFDSRARSFASAHGLMQIIPVTARKIATALQVEDFREALLQKPAVSIRFGAWYVAELLHKFHDNPVLAVGAYNAGPVAMQSWMKERAGMPIDEFVESIPYRETRHYIRHVLENLAVYTWLHDGRKLVIAGVVPAEARDNIDF